MNSSTSSEDFTPLNTPHPSDFELPSTVADSDPTLSFIRGRKGSDHACFDGFIFSKDRTRPNGDIYWQCHDRKTYTPFCTIRLYTQGKEIVKKHTEHNHPIIICYYNIILLQLLILNNCHAIMCWVFATWVMMRRINTHHYMSFHKLTCYCWVFET